MAESPDTNSEGVIRLSLSSDGTPLDPSIRVVSVTITKALNKIPVARIVLLDGDMPNKDFPLSNGNEFKPGAEIAIKAGYEQAEEVLFEGLAVKHSLQITGANDANLVIECRDKAVAMTIGRHNANFVDSTDADIISTLIGNYSGLSSEVSSTTTTHKELVQYYCTDWDFALARAEANGLLVAVDDGTITIKEPQFDEAVLKVTYGTDLMEFSAETDARTQLTAVQGVSWDLKNQEALEGKAVKPSTLNSQGDLDSATLAKVVGPASFRLQTAAPQEKTDLEAWANGQQLKAGLARIRGHMKFQGNAKAKIGTQIEILGVGNRFEGKVFTSAVTHEIEDGNWTTDVEFGLAPDWFAERQDLVAPPAAGLVPGVGGLQVGVVKKLDEDPEGQYKIQVSVPILQAESEGVWARLTQFYASEGIGTFFAPEIGDEVVLGYFNDDPSHPVILGSLYSSNRKPSYELTKENFTKAIVTKSKMKIEFDDEKKVITVVTPGNNQIIISDDAQSILLQDQTGNKIELGTGGIVLDSPKDISIAAKGKITLDAVGEIAISSKADVKTEGLNLNSTAKVGFVAKANATAELSASGQTTIKGATVMIN